MCVTIALYSGALNSWNAYTLFENDRYFSHLSTLEREMTFRTEMGLYYSYFKTLVEANSFSQGVHELVYNNLTEYPETINTLKRFNLYPEVVIGLAFRIFNQTCNNLSIPSKNCWMINRPDLPPVESCSGLGDPATFYITSVYLWNGLSGFALPLLATMVSDSLLGTVLSCMCYFFNYNEATRIQWTPPLRESFAYPLLLLQMALTTHLLSAPVNIIWCILYVTLTTSCLLCWQFSQFALLTQICALFVVFSLHSKLNSRKFQYLCAMHLCALFIAYNMLFLNDMLFTSLYSSTVTAVLVVSSFRVLTVSKQTRLRIPLQFGSVTVIAVTIKIFLSFILQIKDDSHIWSILRAKISNYRDFHTMLYMCAPEFDFLQFNYVEKTWLTLLVPLTCSFVILLTNAFFRRMHVFTAELLYNVYQTLSFVVMALTIMRLKMFLTPHLCILSSVAAGKMFFGKNGVRLTVFVAILAAITVPGWREIQRQHSQQGEYSNPDLEELLIFIDKNVDRNHSFAGPMPLMANILLSTRRPIVNHPHYEDSHLREKTKVIYTLLSRKPLREVYSNIKKLKAQMVVLPRSWCAGKMRTGCSLVDIWDHLDPQNRHKLQVCELLANGDTEQLFDIVFQNDEYTMLQLR